jgi:hypothetical protein
MDTASNANRSLDRVKVLAENEDAVNELDISDKNDHESADDVCELTEQRHADQDFDINGVNFEPNNADELVADSTNNDFEWNIIMD